MLNDGHLQCLTGRLHLWHGAVRRQRANTRITNSQPKISGGDVKGRQRLTSSACVLANVVNEFTRGTRQCLGR